MTATEAETAARDPEFKETAGRQHVAPRRRARQKNSPRAISEPKGTRTTIRARGVPSQCDGRCQVTSPPLPSHPCPSRTTVTASGGALGFHAHVLSCTLDSRADSGCVAPLSPRITLSPNTFSRRAIFLQYTLNEPSPSHTQPPREYQCNQMYVYAPSPIKPCHLHVRGRRAQPTVPQSILGGLEHTPLHS